MGLRSCWAPLRSACACPPLVGYLLAGVMIGPFTPGFVADQELAPQLAELGVILLMFGVGLHFSLSELLAVKAIAIPGAVAQMGFATLMGVGLASYFGWSLGAGLVFGLSLSVASTVVLLRALQERRLVATQKGRIAVGWLIVEDVAMVLALVLLPAVAEILGGRALGPQGADPGVAFAREWLGLDRLSAVVSLTLLKVALFVALMLVVGRRVIPWTLHYVAHSGSRELFRLAVLAIALGVAFGSAQLFGVSFALGAFFAGLILAESPLSQQAANDTLPLRDAFAVLFFVSVGMLFDPAILVRAPGPVLATLLIIVIGKSLVALALVLAFRYPLNIALTISVSLAQVGEFSFILAGLGVALQLLPVEGKDLILAGALLSIMLNPLLFYAVERFAPAARAASASLEGSPAPSDQAHAADAENGDESPADLKPTRLSGHAVIVGYGRVGRFVASDFKARGVPFLVIEEREELVRLLRAEGVEVKGGRGDDPDLLKAANMTGARWLVSAIPNPFEASSLIVASRASNPRLIIVARAHSDEEFDHLKRYGTDHIVMAEREIAREISRYVELDDAVT